MKNGVILNHDEELYVFPTGNGFSCIGFDVLEARYTLLAFELLRVIPNFSVPMPELRGTVQRHAQYEALRSIARTHHEATGYRFTCGLVPALVGLEGKRVEVETKYGETVRFYVGRSTGWIPCHLQIERRSSSGGGALAADEVVTVKKILS